MPAPSEYLRPDEAWSRYEPSADEPWNRARAAHLFRRAGLGATRSQLDDAVRIGPAAVIDQLLAAPPEQDSFTSASESLADTLISTGNSERLAAWWCLRMLGTPYAGLEKLTLFWHGHFATSAEKVTDPRLMLAQNRLLRRHAAGPFEPFVQEISRDAAMLIYLDSASNRKAHPNENYARELMELFCLGIGAYSEQDVQQIARCFTGWEVFNRQYRFNPSQHDRGDKSILGRSGPFGGEDAVRVVVAQPAATRFIARKLVKFYACDDDTLPNEWIQPLADELAVNQFEIGPVVRRIVSSRFFFSPASMGRKIRSPIDFGIGLLRALEGTTNANRLASDLGELGQYLFYPPNVKGWDGGRAWINSSTLLGRANLVGRLVNGGETRFAGGDLAKLADRNGASSPDEIVAWLEETLLAKPIPGDVRKRLVDLAATTSDRSRGVASVLHALGGLPEFQLC